MARALLLPLLEDGRLPRQRIQAVVGSPASAERLRQDLGLAVGTEAQLAWQAPVVLLAVKPQQLERIAAGAPLPAAQPGAGAGGLGRPLLISVLAGVGLERLQRLFSGWSCVRAVPNTPCLARAGLTALAFGEGVSAAQREWVEGLFSAVGQVMELPESQLDGFLALASSGPAVAALLLEALADGGVAAGLPRQLSSDLAAGMLSGTIALLRQEGLHPGQLKDMVASPAGTTVAALRRLERAGVRSALIEAVLAAAERSRELG